MKNKWKKDIMIYLKDMMILIMIQKLILNEKNENLIIIIKKLLFLIKLLMKIMFLIKILLV